MKLVLAHLLHEYDIQRVGSCDNWEDNAINYVNVWDMPSLLVRLCWLCWDTCRLDCFDRCALNELRSQSILNEVTLPIAPEFHFTFRSVKCGTSRDRQDIYVVKPLRHMLVRMKSVKCCSLSASPMPNPGGTTFNTSERQRGSEKRVVSRNRGSRIMVHRAV